MSETQHQAEAQRTVWIRTEPTLDGTGYMAILEADDDTARYLSPADAMRYATAVLDAAARAEFDACVVRQMTDVNGVGHEATAMLVKDLRADRPPVDEDGMSPLGLDPGVNRKHEPFLTVLINGNRVGQWTPADARKHALEVLEVVTGADLDAAYYRLLRGVVGLDENRARNIVGDLANYRPPREED